MAARAVNHALYNSENSLKITGIAYLAQRRIGMKKTDKARQKRLQAKRTKKNQSRKNKTYNPDKYKSLGQNLSKDTVIL